MAAQAYLDELMLCTCGQAAVVHNISPKGVRTSCTHQDEQGPCPCRVYESAKEET